MSIVLANVDKIVDSSGNELSVADAVTSVSSGGGNTIELTASGAINAGDPVCINVKGEIEKFVDRRVEVNEIALAGNGTWDLLQSSYPQQVATNANGISCALFRKTDNRPYFRFFKMQNGQVQWGSQVGVVPHTFNDAGLTITRASFDGNPNLFRFYGVENGRQLAHANIEVNDTGTDLLFAGSTASGSYQSHSKTVSDSSGIHQPVSRQVLPVGNSINRFYSLSKHWSDGVGYLNSWAATGAAFRRETFTLTNDHPNKADFVYHPTENRIFVTFYLGQSQKYHLFEPSASSDRKVKSSYGEIYGLDGLTNYTYRQTSKLFYHQGSNKIVHIFSNYNPSHGSNICAQTISISGDTVNFDPIQKFNYGQSISHFDKSDIVYDSVNDVYIVIGGNNNTNLVPDNWVRYRSVAFLVFKIVNGQFVKQFATHPASPNGLSGNIDSYHFCVDTGNAGYYLGTVNNGNGLGEVYFDYNSISNQKDSILGIANTTATQGQKVKVSTWGNIVDTAESLIPSVNYYYDLNGKLTNDDKKRNSWDREEVLIPAGLAVTSNSILLKG